MKRGQTTRKSRRLWALILLTALVLSLTPAAFADGGAAKEGKLSITPTTILDGELYTARLISAGGAAVNSSPWESFVFEVENRSEESADFTILYAEINGLLMDFPLFCTVQAGETATAYCDLDKTLLGLAGISRIESLKLCMTVYDESYNATESDWVEIPVKDTRKAPYVSVTAQETVLLEQEDPAFRVTLIGIAADGKFIDVYFKGENLSDEEILYSADINKVNGVDTTGYLVFFGLPRTTAFSTSYFFADEAIESLRSLDLEQSVNYDSVGQFSVDISGTVFSVPAPVEEIEDDDLMSIAREAEETCEGYSTVSTGKAPLELPREEDYLDVIERMDVKFTKNGALLILPKPGTGYGNLGSIAAGTRVSVIAERKGYYFFVADDGRMGWTGKDNLNK